MNNKIILATSGVADTENLFNCIRELIRDTAPMIIEAPVSTNSMLGTFPDPRTLSEIRDLAFANTDRFIITCRKSGIKHAERPDFDSYQFSNLVNDSRYADLIVCPLSLLSGNSGNSQVKEGVQLVLRKLECALFAVPDNLGRLYPLDLFAFDGSADSIQAIKMFNYLFPQRAGAEALLYNSNGTAVGITEMTSWIAAHYPKFRWVKKLPPDGQYNLVCGAFGRSGLSNLIHKSFAAEVIAAGKTPVFIYHL